MDWKQEKHYIGIAPTTRKLKPKPYERYIIDPVFGSGGGMYVDNSQIRHYYVSVLNNAAGVGGGVNVRNSKMHSIDSNFDWQETQQLLQKKLLHQEEQQQKNKKAAPASTAATATDTATIAMLVYKNTAYRVYPFGRNILDKDANIRMPHSGGQGGGVSMNLWYTRYTQCIKDGTMECIPMTINVGGSSSIEDIQILNNTAHTMGGGLSIGGIANVTRVQVVSSRSLFGGSMGVQDGSSVILSSTTLKYGDASVFMRGDGMSDDTTCNTEGGYGGLLYLAEGASVRHEHTLLQNGKASRAGGGVTYGSSELCELYANTTTGGHKREIQLIGSNSILSNCQIDVDLENLGRATDATGATDATDATGGNGTSAAAAAAATPLPVFSSPSVGGGMYSDGMNFRASGWLVQQCHATKGGGTFIKVPAIGHMSQMSYSFNHAVVQGGGLEIEEGAQVTMEESLFQHNHAGQTGGAIAILAQTSKNTRLVLTTTTIQDNYAPSGGGMYVSFSPHLKLKIHSSTFENNVATTLGGVQ